jgi:hypothetical protein
MKCTIGALLLVLLISCKEEGDIVFQDTFDYYDVGDSPKLPWEKEGQGIVKIDTSRSHSGSQSMYFETGNSFDEMAFVSLSGNPLFPFSFNRITGSMYVWLEATDSLNSPWSMIVATGRVRDEKYDAELSIGGHLDQLTMNYDTWQLDTDCWQPMQAQIPTDQWVKIAWQFDGMNHTASFWINDVLQKSLSVDKRSQKCMGSALNNQWQFPVFNELLLGWVNYDSTSSKRKLWIDDVSFYH